MKRIGLWIATNIAIVVMLSIVLNIVMAVLGIEFRSTAGIFVIALVFGMGGSVISLLMSKKMAKWSTKATVIDSPRSNTEAWLLETVARLAKQANIGMPEVAVYESNDINAFATGANRNNALVAVSTGLLNNMEIDEAEAVLAHEVAHIANGDMITLTLLQGVLNTFVIFAARIVANIIDNFLAGDDEEGGLGFFGYLAVIIVLEIVFGLLASIIVKWYSRRREYAADAGSAALVGKEKMIAALQRLQNSQPSQLHGELVAFGILGNTKELFASHPPLTDRISRLQNS
ncbi:protease HtpX [Salinibius halmophilus]|uniref:protease HtpX n=1 Tax=Salinibius halmophilus TaxID=1853216 RepID=UPI000E66F2DB|nr:protease HtpX [Salinibius halmophilus]